MAKRSIPGIRAIVTGVSSDIGRELVLHLAQQGAHVVGIARRVERLEALAESCASMPGKFHYVAGDVTDAAVRAAALAKAKEAYGGLDLLINNAGIGAMGPFDTADPARLRRVFEVNFFAPLEFIREALPELKAGRQPMVVNVASTLGHVGLPKLSEYSASKFALPNKGRLSSWCLATRCSMALPAMFARRWGRNASRSSPTSAACSLPSPA